MSGASGKRSQKPSSRLHGCVVNFNDSAVETSVEPLFVPPRQVVNQNFAILNLEVEDSDSNNIEGLTTNTGMASMNINFSSIVENVNNAAPENGRVLSVVPGDRGIPQEQTTAAPAAASVEEPNTKALAGNNSIENNAIEMVLNNANEIIKLNDELKALHTVLELMRRDIDVSTLGIQSRCWRFMVPYIANN